MHQVLILSCTSESVWMHFNNWSSKILTPEYLILQVWVMPRNMHFLLISQVILQMVFNAHFEEHLEPRQNAHFHWKNCFYHVENPKKFIFTFICISHSIHFWNKRKSPPLIWIFVHFGCYTLWIVVLAKIIERPLTSKEIKPVTPKGNQSWIFIGRTDAKNEPVILLLPDAKNKPIGKNPDARKDWGQEEKGVTEDEMVGWHHWLNRRDFEQTSENNEGQGSLVCCSSRGCKKLDTT